MDSVSRRRWSLAFVAYRWRHLMWTFPLAGLLVAGAIEWQKYQRSFQPSGEIEAAPPSRLPVPPLFAGRFPAPGFAEIRDMALSDEVLAAACEYAELSRNGNSLEKCIAELRSRVECTPLPGSPSATLISIRGKPSSETRLLAEAVVRKVEWYADKTAFAERKRLLKQEEIEVATLKLAIDNWRIPIHVKRTNSGQPLNLPSDYLLEKAAAQNNYSERKSRLYAATGYHGAYRGPLLVKRWPWKPLPPPTTRQRLEEGAPTLMLGIGTGILAGVVLAYLLEALLPKRQQRPAQDSLIAPEP